MTEADREALSWLGARTYWTVTRSGPVFLLDLDGVEYVGASLAEAVQEARHAVASARLNLE